jgi:hypothetical protein
MKAFVRGQAAGDGQATGGRRQATERSARMATVTVHWMAVD